MSVTVAEGLIEPRPENIREYNGNYKADFAIHPKKSYLLIIGRTKINFQKIALDWFVIHD
jgi:hypothetical protein